MSRPPPPETTWRARLRRCTPVALLALAPKGVCCLAAYAAGGALFGRELCGEREPTALVTFIPWLGGAASSVAWWFWWRRR